MTLRPAESETKSEEETKPNKGCILAQNIGIITTLMLKQIRPVGTKIMLDKKGKEAVFYFFPDTEEAQRIVESYYKNQILIEPKRFYEMTHLIRKEIFQIKNHIGGMYGRWEEVGRRTAEKDNGEHDRNRN